MLKTLKRRFYKVRLNYTEEMKVQDEMWEREEEDLDKMEKLHEQIISEAMSKGFTGAVFTYRSMGTEVITDVYDSQEDLEEESLHGHGIMLGSLARCNFLIEYLENHINQV